MRVMNVHNYHVGPGGMEVLFEAITAMLRAAGHEVLEVTRDNKSIKGLSGRLAVFGSMLHSPSAKREVAALVRDFRPDVAHVHNLWPQLSTSVLDAFREADVPVVMAVQDYKLTCPTAQHLRHGKVCELCLDGSQVHCATNNCRESWPMSVAFAARNAYFRGTGAVTNNVSVYLCSSAFARATITRGGYPADRCVVAQNFTALGLEGDDKPAGSYLGYVGRISPEKGLPVLIEAARVTGVPVKIAGDTSKMPELPATAPANVEFVGRVGRAELPAFYREMRALVVPSIWYEGLPVVSAEAMGRAVPLVASDVGGLAEAVEEGVSGFKCPMSDVPAFAARMRQLWDDPALAQRMGRAARDRCAAQFTQDVFFKTLMHAYDCAREWPRPWAKAKVAA